MAYFVYRGKIGAMLQGILLEFSVVVQHRLSVFVVQGQSFAVLGLASPSPSSALGLTLVGVVLADLRPAVCGQSPLVGTQRHRHVKDMARSLPTPLPKVRLGVVSIRCRLDHQLLAVGLLELRRETPDIQPGPGFTGLALEHLPDHP